MSHTDRFGDKVQHVNTAAFFGSSRQNPLNKKPQDYSPENLKSNTRRPMVAGTSPMPQRASAANAYQLAIREMLTTPITRRA